MSDFELENKWTRLYGLGYLVTVTCVVHDADVNCFSATYQERGKPETQKNVPRQFSVEECLDWILKKVEK